MTNREALYRASKTIDRLGMWVRKSNAPEDLKDYQKWIRDVKISFLREAKRLRSPS